MAMRFGRVWRCGVLDCVLGSRASAAALGIGIGFGLAVGPGASSAAAQGSGTILVSIEHLGGGPAVVAMPGEAVRVRYEVSWGPSTAQLIGMAGDMVCEPIGGGMSGIVSNITSEFTPGTSINLGTVVGDDILGFEVWSVPA